MNSELSGGHEPCPPSDFPLQELERIDDTIEALTKLLGHLLPRRTTLRTELEHVTRPTALPLQPTYKIVGPGLRYRGEAAVRYGSNVRLYIGLLTRLWTDFPERREAMAGSMALHGTSRSYVAMTRSYLFPGKSAGWVNRYSEQLVPGWYVDTNMSRERMRTILPIAVAAAGLNLGADVEICWG